MQNIDFNEILEKTDLNSHQFNCQIHFRRLLQSNSINQIIMKNNELQNDIKNYDHDIQNLVFENYYKFITSIETVKKMKDNINQVEGKIQKLEEAMAKINNLTSTINESLETKHQEIKKLDTVNKDLSKLKNLCEFPLVLKQELEQIKMEQQNVPKISEMNFENLFPQSIVQYVKCFETLQQYQNEQLVKPLFLESIHYVEEIRQILWHFQNNKSLDLYQVRLVTQKLILILDDEVSVLKNYMKISKDKLITILEEKIQLTSKVLIKNFLQNINQKLQLFLKQNDIDLIISQYLEQINPKSVELQSLIQFKDKTASQSNIQQESMEIFQGTIQQIIPLIEEEIVYLFQTITSQLKENNQLIKDINEDAKSSSEEIMKININYIYSNKFSGESLKKIIENHMKEFILQILKKIGDIICFKPTSQGNTKFTNQFINNSFKFVYQELNSLMERNSQFICRYLKREIIDRFSESIEHAFRGYFLDSFQKQRMFFLKQLQILKESTQQICQDTHSDIVTTFESTRKIIQNLILDFKNQLFCKIAFTLLELKPFLVIQDIFLNQHSVFLSLLHQQFTEFLQKFIPKILTLTPNKLSQAELVEISQFIYTKESFTQGQQQQKQSQLYLSHESYPKQQKQTVSQEIENSLKILFKIEPENNFGTFQLVINQFLQIFKKEVVEKFYSEILFEIFHKQEEVSQVNEQYQKGHQALKRDIQTNKISNLLQQLDIQINKNIKNFLEFYSFFLGQQLHSYFSNYQLPELKNQDFKISNIILTLVLNLRKVFYIDLSIMFPDQKKINMTKKQFFLKEQKIIDFDMQRMLARKSTHFFEKNLSKQSLSKNQILLALIKMLYKSIIEFSRRLVFTTQEGFFQLYIDMSFLTQFLLEIVSVDDEQLIIGYFQEIIENFNAIWQIDIDKIENLINDNKSLLKF